MFRWTCQCGKTGTAPNKNTAQARMETHWGRPKEHSGKAQGKVAPK